MSSRMGVSTLVVGMFLTGCANSLLTKYQDKECVENCDNGMAASRVNFEQPVWQTLNMFIGEFFCCLPLIWRYYSKPSKPDVLPPQASMFTRILARLPYGPSSTVPEGYGYLGTEEDEEETEGDSVKLEIDDTLSGWRVCWMWFPAFFDICGTTLMNVGLILTPVSIYQMSRGALVLWVGVLSVIFLRRRLFLYQWASLIIVMLGVLVVGLSGSLVKANPADKLPGDGGGSQFSLRALAEKPTEDPTRVAFGVILILFAQVFTASQYVVEEKIMSRYKVEPLAAVSLEGFFGGVTTIIAMPILHLLFHDRSPYFDVPRGWHQIISHPPVWGSCVAIMFSIGAFNFFGLSVTSRVSATTRSTVDTCRTLGIWIVSLGVGWEKLVWPFSLLQILGFGMLVYGTFVFNGLIAPLLFAGSASVHLPREPELEATGEVPAAGAQGRAGYDIVPETSI
ncbi:hypothetical protein P7C73_g1737, partial [Tremellales sp. Uapishka_1]